MKRAAAKLLFCLFLLVSSGMAAQPADSIRFETTGLPANGLSRIRLHPDGRLFGVHPAKSRLYFFSTADHKTDSLGRQGTADYAFYEPAAIDLTNGLKTYVLDRGNRRIQIFDRRNQFLSSVSELPAVSGIKPLVPLAITVDIFGQLFIWDQQSQSVVRFKPNGQFERTFHLTGVLPEFTTPMLVSLEDRLAVADAARQELYFYSPDLVYMNWIKLPELPLDMIENGGGLLILTSKSIISFHKKGGLQTSVLHGLEDVKSVALSRKSLYVLTGQTIAVCNDAGILQQLSNGRR